MSQKRHIILKGIILALTTLFPTMGAKADVIPSKYYSTVSAGTYYLYNVTQQQFLTGTPSMSSAPVALTLAVVDGTKYSISPATNQFLKMGKWGEQYLWNNGWADTGFFKWSFTINGTSTYNLSITATSDADGYFTNGITYYLNTVTTAPSTSASEADKWALITETDYYAYLASSATIPSTYYSTTPSAGTYYLYNIKHGGFLYRGGDGNYAGLTANPTGVALTSNGAGAFYIRFSDGKYLKTGSWSGYNVWTDATDESFPWTFESFHSVTGVYYVKCPLDATDQYIYSDGIGTRGVNARNTKTVNNTEDAWALITPVQYRNYLMSLNAGIPSMHFSAAPAAVGEYYIYDVLNNKFLNTSVNEVYLTDYPEATTTVTPAGEKYLISGMTDKYLKIGVYRGRYLWGSGENGVGNYTNWTIEKMAGDASNIFYIHSDDFGETNAEVSGKDMYITDWNASADQPLYSQWALIPVSDYTTFDATAAGRKRRIAYAKGNATFLITDPKFDIAAGSDNGWTGGTATNCNTWLGGDRDYENASASATFSQTLNNMPAGTYKLVAAVRGAEGTTATANLNGTAGTTISNHSFNTSYQQINSNGVQMPWSSLGGFSTMTNALGWRWATATYTLVSDGDLTLNFVMESTGWKGVDDVHLYYMTDGTNTYAVEYSDGVDAANHAVTCDFATDNPNKVFTSTVPLKNAINANLNNNLVDGTIANMVLYDGFDFTPPIGEYAATSAMLYRSLTADKWYTLTLPFVPSTELTKKVTSELRGGSWVVFVDAEAANDQPMLVKSGSALTAITGSRTSSATGDLTAGEGVIMQGTYNRLAPVANDNYIISNNQILRVNNTNGAVNMNAFRAYFAAPNGETKAEFFHIDFGDQETGIQVNVDVNVEKDVYDLSGRRVSSLHAPQSSIRLKKGIYVIEGRKIIVR